mmetsp:Transcript_35186/g.74885  ORF Transcript_35186/g.74885 Transcript_35186/m.74885 type:complete len:238 (+) Transcript_35186:136-849(+)
MAKSCTWNSAEFCTRPARAFDCLSQMCSPGAHLEFFQYECPWPSTCQGHKRLRQGVEAEPSLHEVCWLECPAPGCPSLGVAVVACEDQEVLVQLPKVDGEAVRVSPPAPPPRTHKVVIGFPVQWVVVLATGAPWKESDDGSVLIRAPVQLPPTFLRARTANAPLLQARYMDRWRSHSKPNQERTRQLWRGLRDRLAALPQLGTGNRPQKYHHNHCPWQPLPNRGQRFCSNRSPKHCG